MCTEVSVAELIIKVICHTKRNLSLKAGASHVRSRISVKIKEKKGKKVSVLTLRSVNGPRLWCKHEK